MRCLRVYADEKGDSHFSDMEIAMSEAQPHSGRTIQMSTPVPTANIKFLTYPPTTGIPRQHGNS